MYWCCCCGYEIPTLTTVRAGLAQGWKEVDKELVGPFFGWNLTTAAVGKIVKVGDPVQVTRRRDPTTLSPIYIN